MAGIGKSAFAVHAAHRLAAGFPDGQIFLYLHGHTPGQRPVDPADALASLLQTAGVAVAQIPPGLEGRMRLWRDYLAGQRLLIVLDDAAGHEQVRPLLPGTAGSLVLVTSRRHLTALEDARAISLDTLPDEEAAGLLIRLADRPGLVAGDPAVAEICRLCGYLPLAIGMLARQLHHHPAWTAADLAADLAVARDRLEMMRAENLSVRAAFDLSYQDLTGDQRRLFRRLGLHPGTDVDAYAAAALDETEPDAARRHLDALYDQNLLTEPARGRYRPHDLIREHARILAAADPSDQNGAASDRLLDYYLHTARAASRLLARRTSAGAAAVTVVPPAHAPELSTREDAVAWMDAERLNLHAAADFAARHDRPGHATAIATAMQDFLRSRSHWDQALILHRAALEAARYTGDQLAEAGALTDLGDMQRLTGDYPAAAACSARALELYRSLGNRLGQAGALTDLSAVQRVTGDYRASAASLGQALEAYRELGDRLGEAGALTYLGLLQRVTGENPAAAVTLAEAIELCRDIGYRLGEGHARAELGAVQRLTGHYPAAIANLTGALELYLGLGYRVGEANALTDLGLVRHLTGDHPAAVASLEQALELHRDLGHPLGEANALNYLGAAQHMSGDPRAAAATLDQARELSRDLGYRFGEVTALNNMGELLLATATPARARACYRQALAIAGELGSLTEEACALEGIGRCDLQDGHPEQGAGELRQALAIYRRVGSPNADRVAAKLRS
jgi:tetratricopeptide (TPR) repeat protein